MDARLLSRRLPRRFDRPRLLEMWAANVVRVLEEELATFQPVADKIHRPQSFRKCSQSFRNWGCSLICIVHV